jgi:ABC-type multidrug transport system fused ATPase/permease subunit
VTFSYDEKSKFKLNNLNFKIQPGFTAAIVGHSGAGKSTIFNLLLRFYDVSSGQIKINGQNIMDYDLEYLRQNTAVVFQDTYLFNGTIEENIRLARADATEAEVVEAAKAANAYDFISSFPDGFKTIIGEFGLNLSGGERQRLAIARAILKKAKLLLLDEATSNVDACSETLIQSALANLAAKTTSVIIAHRLSTIQNANVIFVLEAGNLLDYGSHEELMAHRGVYSQFINSQLQGANNG